MNTTRGSLPRTAAVLVALVALAAGACTRAGRSGPEGSAGAGDGPGGGLQLVGALQSFAACDELLGYLHREGARLVGPYGLGGGMIGFADDFAAAPTAGVRTTGAAEQQAAAAAPVAGDDYSATNVQEAGVDEPDLVKTDGRLLVTVEQGALRVVDVGGDQPRLLATLPVAGTYGPAELLLAGDRVLVLHQAEPPYLTEKPAVREESRGIASPVHPRPPQARVTVVDVAEPASPKVAAELTLDGSLVSARMVDGVARLVLRSDSPRIAFVQPTDRSAAETATEANRRLVEASTLDDWLPGYTYAEPGGEPSSRRLADCREVARPQEFSGLAMLSVLTVGADDPRPGPAATVLGAGETVYAGPEHLYVTTSKWLPPVPAGGPGTGPGSDVAFVPAPVAATTEVHKFDIADKVQTSYQASGTVPGRLLNQYSMSEHEGDLRVATTTDGVGGAVEAPGASESQVVVLRQGGAALRTVGSVGGLGKGEQIRAVRFLGDQGYVVTFRQTDPLYVIDLADPGSPAVRGELKIPGYSAYLHPVGEHRLLGVGQEATEQGRVLGTQLSLFDVSDPASPRRLAQRVVGQGYSEAEFDPHAFLYWGRTRLAALPLQVGSGFGAEAAEPFQGAIGFSVGERSIGEVGRVRHRGGDPIRRSLVVGDRLLTLSERGLLTSDLETLGERAWLGF